MNNKNDFFTIPEAAQTLRCSEKTIQRLIKDRTLVASYVADRWIVSRESIVRFLNDQANTLRRPFSE